MQSISSLVYSYRSIRSHSYQVNNMFTCKCCLSQVRTLSQTIHSDGRELDRGDNQLLRRRLQLVLDPHRHIEHRSRCGNLPYLRLEEESPQFSCEEVSGSASRVFINLLYTLTIVKNKPFRTRISVRR